MIEAEGRERIVAGEIARYLERRPNACDTEEGVLRWWIPRVRLEEEITVVHDALALLVMLGIVERCVLRDGLVMFRRLQSEHHGEDGGQSPAVSDGDRRVRGE